MSSRSIGTFDRGRWAAFLAVVAPLVLFDLGSGSYDTPRWIAIWLIAAALIAFCAWRTVRGATIRFGWPELLALAFVGWAAVSLTWSPDPLAGVAPLLNLVALVVVFLGVRHIDAFTRAASIAITAAVAWALVMWLVLPESGWPLLGECRGKANCGIISGFGNWNVVANFFVMALPFAAAAAFKRPWLMPVPLAAVIYLVFFNQSKIEYLALTAFACWYLVDRGKWKMLAFGLPASLGALMLVFPRVLYSFETRAEIVVNTLSMWIHNIVVGWGWGSFTNVYPNFADHHVWLLGPKTFMKLRVLPGAAHNEFGQVLAELGFIGGVLVALFLWGIVRQAERNARPMGLSWRANPIRQAAAASVFFGVVCSMVNFPLQAPATAMLFAVSAGIVLSPVEGRVVKPWRAIRAATFAFSLAGFLVIGYASPRLWLSTAHSSQIKLEMKGWEGQKPRPALAFIHSRFAFKYWPYAPKTRLMLWHAAVFWHDKLPPKIRLSHRSMDRIYDVASRAAPNQTALLAMRASYLFSSGRYLERAKEMELITAKLKALAWLHPETFVIEAQWAVIRKDKARALKAIDRIAALDDKRPAIAQAAKALTTAAGAL